MPALASAYTGVLPLYGGNTIYGERSQDFRVGRTGGNYLDQNTIASSPTDLYQTTSADQTALERLHTDYSAPPTPSANGNLQNTESEPSYSSDNNNHLLPTDTESQRVYSGDDNPPRVAPHAQPDDAAPETKESSQRSQEFMRGMGQGLRHMFSLPGLLTLGAGVVIGAVLPWAVPWMVLAGLGFGLFNVIAGMSSDNWEQAGQGAFSLLSSVVLGTILSDLFPGNGRGGLNLNPFRDPGPLQFKDYCGDPFKGVNGWWSFPSSNNTGLVGVSYNTPWTQWAVPLNSASAATSTGTVAPAGTSAASVSGMMTAMAETPAGASAGLGAASMIPASAAPISPSVSAGTELIASAPSSELFSDTSLNSADRDTNVTGSESSNSDSDSSSGYTESSDSSSVA